MTAKEFLMLGWRVENRIDKRSEELERLRERAEAVRSSAPKSGPRGGRRADWTDAVAAIADAEARINADIVRLCRVRRLIDEAIGQVPVMNQRRVLEMRYRNYMTWEDIAREIPCDVRTVYRLHGRALLNIHVPEVIERPASPD